MHRLLIAVLVVFAATNARAQPGRLPNPDKDGDGRVTLAEFQAVQAVRQARAFKLLDRDGNGRLEAAEIARSPRMAGVLRALDANRDGAVTRQEMQSGGEARFRAADANKDGWLSKAELAVLRQGAGGGANR